MYLFFGRTEKRIRLGSRTSRGHFELVLLRVHFHAADRRSAGHQVRWCQTDRLRSLKHRYPDNSDPDGRQIFRVSGHRGPSHRRSVRGSLSHIFLLFFLLSIIMFNFILFRRRSFYRESCTRAYTPYGPDGLHPLSAPDWGRSRFPEVSWAPLSVTRYAVG